MEPSYRYMDKICIIKSLDPYETPNKDWNSDYNLSPQFCSSDIFAFVLWAITLQNISEATRHVSLVQFSNL